MNKNVWNKCECNTETKNRITNRKNRDKYLFSVFFFFLCVVFVRTRAEFLIRSTVLFLFICIIKRRVCFFYFGCYVRFTHTFSTLFDSVFFFFSIYHQPQSNRFDCLIWKKKTLIRMVLNSLCDLLTRFSLRLKLFMFLSQNSTLLVLFFVRNFFSNICFLFLPFLLISWWILACNSGFYCGDFMLFPMRLQLLATVLTHACACFGGWSGAMEAGWRVSNGIPTVRRAPDGVRDSCINGIFDDALSLDSISSRSICQWKQEIETYRSIWFRCIWGIHEIIW